MGFSDGSLITLGMSILVLYGGVVFALGIQTGTVANQFSILNKSRQLDKKPLSWLIITAFIVLSIAIATHNLPGFSRLVIAHDLFISPGAIPYHLYFNFDSAMMAIAMMAFLVPCTTTRKDWLDIIRLALFTVFVLTLLIIPIALATRFINIDIKWPTIYPYWAMSNLFMTCITEEVFFRRIVQQHLIELLVRYSYGQYVALGIASFLFGIAHFAGGPTYMLLASIAGVGYGWVYQRTQRIEASILTHFLLNSIHILFFTYPRLDPALLS
jgi:membrane protease YdiL (CAAX protease family)